MEELGAVNLIFRVRQTILSLPWWHGGRWHAWFREASKKAGLKFDEFALAICPLRFGQKPLGQGEELAVRMLIHPSHWQNLCEFAAGLTTCQTAGLFSAASLRLTKITDLAGGRILWTEGSPGGAGPCLLDAAHFAGQISRLQRLSRFSLVFSGPLRLAAPHGSKNREYEKYKYCQPVHFKKPGFPDFLVRRIRFLEDRLTENSPPGNLETDLQAGCLFWHDMRYNPARHMALGGVCGQIFINGSPRPEYARRLVLGQYLGAGKNGRFGFGFWQIPEISPSCQPGQSQGVAETDQQE